MPYRSNSRGRHSHSGYYAVQQKPYYVKKKPSTLLIRFLVIMIITITMLTGTSLRSSYDVLADVYPPDRVLPPLVEEEETEDKWVKNLVPPVGKRGIYGLGRQRRYAAGRPRTRRGIM